MAGFSAKISLAGPILGGTDFGVTAQQGIGVVSQLNNWIGEDSDIPSGRLVA